MVVALENKEKGGRGPLCHREGDRSASQQPCRSCVKEYLNGVSFHIKLCYSSSFVNLQYKSPLTM